MFHGFDGRKWERARPVDESAGPTSKTRLCHRDGPFLCRKGALWPETSSISRLRRRCFSHVFDNFSALPMPRPAPRRKSTENKCPSGATPRRHDFYRSPPPTPAGGRKKFLMAPPGGHCGQPIFARLRKKSAKTRILSSAAALRRSRGRRCVFLAACK